MKHEQRDRVKATLGITVPQAIIAGVFFSALFLIAFFAGVLR